MEPCKLTPYLAGKGGEPLIGRAWNPVPYIFMCCEVSLAVATGRAT